MNDKADVNEYPASRSVGKSLNVLVVGATGGTGQATVDVLLNDGHRVTAFARSATTLANGSERLITINGDATNAAEIDQAVCGQDVVIVTLGIRENPLRVRVFGAARTAEDVRSAGTRNVISAMRKHGVRRLIVQSSFGVGETRGLLRFFDQLFFKLILKPQIDDTEAQEAVVRNSGVDWVLAQPVHLTDDASNTPPFLSVEGETRIMKVTRKSVARFLSSAACKPDYVGKSVAISG